MKLEIPRSQEEKLIELDKSLRERIKKKLEEIENKVDDFDLEPEKVIEKPLKGKLSGIWQQGVGDYRLWFKIDKEKDILYLEAVYHKEEAEKRY